MANLAGQSLQRIRAALDVIFLGIRSNIFGTYNFVIPGLHLPFSGFTADRVIFPANPRQAVLPGGFTKQADPVIFPANPGQAVLYHD